MQQPGPAHVDILLGEPAFPSGLGREVRHSPRVTSQVRDFRSTISAIASSTASSPATGTRRTSRARLLAARPRSRLIDAVQDLVGVRAKCVHDLRCEPAAA